MAKIFISDLHLEENHPEMAALFLNFLKNTTKTAEALYILGDFFDSWIGDDDLSDFNKMIIDALKTASNQGLAIYFLHGNRDFLLGKQFIKMTGCRLLPDQSVIDLFGSPTLLMHGDTLCTQDVKYLKFRKKARNWFMQQLFLLKSLKKRRAMAKNYREASKIHTQTSAQYIMDVTQHEVRRVMLQHGVNHLIHGHTHREAIHQFFLKENPAVRTVLGAWHTHGSALVCEPNGQYELIVISH